MRISIGNACYWVCICSGHAMGAGWLTLEYTDWQHKQREARLRTRLQRLEQELDAERANEH